MDYVRQIDKDRRRGTRLSSLVMVNLINLDEEKRG
jgi:hypothetical protein